VVVYVCVCVWSWGVSLVMACVWSWGVYAIHFIEDFKPYLKGYNKMIFYYSSFFFLLLSFLLVVDTW